MTQFPFFDLLCSGRMPLGLSANRIESLATSHSVPITYDPQYCSLVFPLGMLTVATLMFANATGMRFLLIIPHVAVYIAIVAWVITFVAMLFKLGNFYLSSRKKASPATQAGK